MSGINIYIRKEDDHVRFEDITEARARVHEQDPSDHTWLRRQKLVKIPSLNLFVGICDEFAGCGAGRRQSLMGIYPSREDAIFGNGKALGGWTGAKFHKEEVSLGTPYRRFSWPLAQTIWELEASLVATRLKVDLGFEAIVDTSNPKQLDLYQKLKAASSSKLSEPVLEGT